MHPKIFLEHPGLQEIYTPCMLRDCIVFARSVASFDQICLLFHKKHPPSDVGLISVNHQFQFRRRQIMVTIFHKTIEMQNMVEVL